MVLYEKLKNMSYKLSRLDAQLSQYDGRFVKKIFPGQDYIY